MPESLPWSFRELLHLFQDEVGRHQGRLQDEHCVANSVFARAVLPAVVDLIPGDRVQAGVALHATIDKVEIRPYVLRHICTNGAILPFVLESASSQLPEASPMLEFTEVRLREKIARCCQPSVFARATRAMHGTMSQDASPLQMLLVVTVFQAELENRRLSRHDRSGVEQLRRRVMEQRRQTVFDLLNSVTAVARDTENPQLKWRLEELGGSLAISAPDHPRNPDGPLAAYRALDDDLRDERQQAALAQELTDRLTAVN